MAFLKIEVWKSAYIKNQQTDGKHEQWLVTIIRLLPIVNYSFKETLNAIQS